MHVFTIALLTVHKQSGGENDSSQGGHNVGEELVPALLFADDMVILAEGKMSS